VLTLLRSMPIPLLVSVEIAVFRMPMMVPDLGVTISPNVNDAIISEVS